MFSCVFSKIKVIAKNRGVAIGGHNNAPVITGDINDSEINIDQKSFAQATFLAQASAFDSCNNKIPLLWATLQCLELLSPDKELREKLKLKFVQDKVSLSVVVLNEEAKNIRLLYSKTTSGEIDKKDLKTIISNIYKDIKPGFTVQIICNKVISKPVKEFYEKAITDEFNTKYFNKEKDSFTSFNVDILNIIFTNSTLDVLKNNSNATSYISPENIEHVSELTKAFAIKLLSQMPSTDFSIIKRHDLEVRFGAEHYSEIFPSPPKFEASIPSNLRNQQESILKSIFRDNKNSIIHARGGVGKTVMVRLADTIIPSHSCSIVYDCFGDGLYRSMLNPRHSFDKVLVQIINELAINGLCDSLIAMKKDKGQLMQEFISCIENSVKCLKKGNKQAHLYIFIDAADNAVMAAKEKAENSIVTQLLNDLMIDGCTVIALCRTERIELLAPRSDISQFELRAFSEEESYAHLNLFYSDVTEEHGKEFHRLSGGNPRVQAYAIEEFPESLIEMLKNLGPTLTTVDAQIEVQLNNAIARLKNKNTTTEGLKIDLICTALASLPPFIPIDVISKLSNLSEDEIASFISDFGRGLMLIDKCIQFRDEPTETWFRKQFASTAEQAKEFVKNIQEIANSNSYVSECLPYLMLAGGNHEDLIELALSEEFLPKGNPVDARSISTSRLNAALKSAIQLEDYFSFIKLALRTGEEFAGDQRQIELLNQNVTLIGIVQSPTEVQKLAFQGRLSGGWKGSENLYKSALLSLHGEFKGEALSYLRAAENWLSTYFKSTAKDKRKRHEEKLSAEDVALLFTVYLNLLGPEKAVNRIIRFSPSEAVQNAIATFTNNLLDTSRFEDLKQLAFYSKEHSYVCINFINSLFLVQQSVDEEISQSCLINIENPTSERNEKANISISTLDLLIFIEYCFAAGYDNARLKNLLIRQVKLEPKAWYANPTTYHNDDLLEFVGIAALLEELTGKSLPENQIFPNEFLADDLSYKQKEEKEKYKKTLSAMLPAQRFLIRSRTNRIENFELEYKDVFDEIGKYLPQAYERKNFTSDFVNGRKQRSLFWAGNIEKPLQSQLFKNIIDDVSYSCLLNGLYYSCRVKSLNYLSEFYETALINTSNNKNDSPESISESYIDIANAICLLAPKQSAKYFNKAIEAASKFGNEALHRHFAILSLAEKSAESNCSPELTYRFARSTETFYEYMSDHFPLERTVRAIHDMDASSSFAIMARWLDREVTYWGPFEDTVLEQSISANTLSCREAWAAQGLIDNKSYAEFFSRCLKKSENPELREVIFNDAVQQALIKGLSKSALSLIKNTGAKFALSSSALDDAIIHFNEHKHDLEPTHSPHVTDKTYKPVDWDSVFNSNSSFISSETIEESITSFKALKDKSFDECFWSQLYDRAPIISAADVLDAILKCKFSSSFELLHALENTPKEWFEREGVKELWIKGFDLYVQLNASTVSNPWWPEHWTSRFKLKADFSKLRLPGVIKALENKSDFDDAEFIFSVITVLSQKLTPSEAKEALNYALDRVELHVDESDADGYWSKWLVPPENNTEAYASFIWSVLANPTSKNRWEGVHIVYRLVELNCNEVIDSMIAMFQRDDIGAFGSTSFPFYKFHAQLYFMIALYRGVQSNALPLLKHSAFFQDQALNSDHILLEHYSVKVARKLLQEKNSTYSAEDIEKLDTVGLSQFNKNTPKETNKFEIANIVPLDKGLPELSFFLDFQEYWLKPLANVFNVSVEELKRTAISIVINEWGVTLDERFIKDPRPHGHKETHARHSSIPSTQPYDFYLGYHVIFTMASRLLKKLPIVEGKYDWEDDLWVDWLSNHLLSMNNGYLLADLRDPAPLVRREWLSKKTTDSWRWEIEYSDFLEGLLLSKGGRTFICVTGSWSDNNGSGNNETYSISSALVSVNNSASLLKALVSCKNPHDYKLPSYNEEQFELDDSSFKMKGWLNEPDEYKKLDEIDPYAGELKFPMRRISKEYEELLNLNYCLLTRKYMDDKGSSQGFSETWTDTRNNDRYSESTIRDGDRLYLSLDTLKHLCAQTKLSLIFEVSIKRQNSTHDRDVPDDVKYPGPYCNLYTLSKDGVIRDYQSRNYQLR
ncbi:hypothetical protein WNY51_08340 [Pseudocolwellia sp. AS88]|uniref:hypothetical protein n=1 Tax=Pseudocolwellia sp. AS88 TaxID=3063958 RepID=UPI0026F0C91E|nr:hypothetical protein [Pseudocolwellia sp. AS88]MDO7085901.1 hypothetical protein [Pseudocolwellia sp. AS88]